MAFYDIPPNPYSIPSSQPSPGQNWKQRLDNLIEPPVVPADEGATPAVYVNPSSNKMFVNGAEFDADDHGAALETVNQLKQPYAGRPQGPGWQKATPESYGKYINNIYDPSLGRLAGKNFGIGVSNLKLLGGSALRFLGAEGYGKEIVDNAVEELSFNSPYAVEFTEVAGNERHDYLDWFVANLSQFGPMLLEQAAVTLVGAGAGAIAGGGANPLTAAGGAIAGLMGRQAYKKIVIETAKKYQRKEVLTKGERKLLREAAALAGATAANLTNSYATGVGDIYNESIETGQNSRLAAAIGAVPYAAFDTLGEYAVALRFFGLRPSSLLTSGGILKRAAKGVGVGGLVEGAAESGQEAVILMATGQSLGDEEATKRFLNSFAAGFAVGAPIGGAVNAPRPRRGAEPVSPGVTELDDGEVVGSNIDESPPPPTDPPSIDPSYVSPASRSFEPTEEQLTQYKEEGRRIDAGERADILGTDATQEVAPEVHPLARKTVYAEPFSDPPVEAETLAGLLEGVVIDVESQSRESPIRIGEHTDLLTAPRTAITSGEPEASSVISLPQDKGVEVTRRKALDKIREELAGDTKKHASAIKKLINVGFFGDTRHNDLTPRKIEALTLVEDLMENNPAKRDMILKLFEERLHTADLTKIYSTAKGREGHHRPWYVFALEHGLIDAATSGRPKGGRDYAPDVVKSVDEVLSSTIARVKDRMDDKNLETDDEIQFTSDVFDLALMERSMGRVFDIPRGEHHQRATAILDDIGSLGTQQGRIVRKQRDIAHDMIAVEHFLRTAAEKIHGMKFSLYHESLPTTTFLYTLSGEVSTKGKKGRKGLTETKAITIRISNSRSVPGKKEADISFDPSTTLKAGKAIDAFYVFDKKYGTDYTYLVWDLLPNVNFPDGYWEEEGSATPSKKDTPASEVPTESVVEETAPLDVQQEEATTVADEGVADEGVVDEGVVEEEGEVDSQSDPRFSLWSFEIAEELKKALKVIEDTDDRWTISVPQSKVSESVYITFTFDDYETGTQENYKVRISDHKAGRNLHGRADFEILAGEDPNLSLKGLTEQIKEWTGFDIVLPKNIFGFGPRETQPELPLESDITPEVVTEPIEQVDPSGVSQVLSEISAEVERIRSTQVPTTEGDADIVESRRREELLKFVGGLGKIAGDDRLNQDTKREAQRILDLIYDDGSVGEGDFLNILVEGPQSVFNEYSEKVNLELRSPVPKLDAELAKLVAPETMQRIQSLSPLDEISPEEMDRLKYDFLAEVTKNIWAKKEVVDSKGKKSEVLAIEARPRGIILFHMARIGAEPQNDGTMAALIKEDEAVFDFLRDDSIADIVTIALFSKDTNLDRGAYPVRGEYLEHLDRLYELTKEIPPEDNVVIDNVVTQAQLELEGKDAADVLYQQKKDGGKTLRPWVKFIIKNGLESEVMFSPEQRKIIDPLIVEDKGITDTGEYYRSDGKLLETPLPVSITKRVIRRFTNNLKITPSVHMYANVEELRTKNPKLYDRAVAGRPPGEFDTTEASGYSIGKDVILFSDHIYTEQQAKFIMAHEVLGHFGMRAFMPKVRLKSLMENIYNKEAGIRQAADVKINQGMNRIEAIEEAIADKAAIIDVQFIARIWSALKTGLRKVGFKFDDDMSRYLIWQSRRNLYRGSGEVSIPQIIRNLNESTDGRFSSSGNLASTWSSAYAMNRTSGVTGIKDNLKRSFNTKKPGDWGRLVGGVVEKFQTLDHMADKSEGLKRIFLLFQAHQHLVKKLHAGLSALSPLTNTPSFFKTPDGLKGATIKQKLDAGELMAYHTLFHSQSTTNAQMNDVGDLSVYNKDTGFYEISTKGWEKLMSKVAGRTSKEELSKELNIKVGPKDPVTGRQEYMTYKPDFEITDTIVTLFKENTAVIQQVAYDKLAYSIEASETQKKRVIQNLLDSSGRKDPASLEGPMRTLRFVMIEYHKMYNEGMEVDKAGKQTPNPNSVAKADIFLAEIQRAFWKQAKVDDWVEKKQGENVRLFEGGNFEIIREGVQDLYNLKIGEQNAYTLVDKIRQLNLLGTMTMDAEFNAKRTVLTSYVPLDREGPLQVTLSPIDANGDVVALTKDFAGIIPYSQVKNEQEARELMDRLNKAFGDQEFTVTVIGEQEPVPVRFRANYSATAETSLIGQSINIVEFMNTLQSLNIKLSPQAMEIVHKALTEAGALSRHNLRREGAPGWNKDIIKSVAKHAERQSHITAKMFYKHEMDSILLDKDLWHGSKRKLDELDEIANAYRRKHGDDHHTFSFQKEYDQYAFMYQHVAPVGNKVKIYSGHGENRTFKIKDTLGLGNRYRDQARGLINFYEATDNIEHYTGDVFSSDAGSKIKLAAVLMQLGGSFAAAFNNTISLVTNSVPFLATYNPKRGYGGGFGFTSVMAELSRATMHMRSHSLSDTVYLQSLVGEQNEKSRKAHGLEPDELEALIEATSEGVLQAAQFNALVGTARSGVNSNQLAAAIKGWMLMFSYTEQLNRRATFLTAYRMERDRLGKVEPSEQERTYKKSLELAIESVNKTQGEYAMYNRPVLARGGLQQYLFMYRQYQFITLQMMRNLPPSGRVYFLATLFLMSGLKGLPFAEDLMDIISTLAEKFEIPIANVEASLGVLINDIAPGMTPAVMKGLLEAATGASLSARLGFGDVIPLTSAARAGARPWQETKNFIGPIYSAIAGSLATGSSLARYAGESVGAVSGDTRLLDIARDSPIAGLRALADGISYIDSGAIVNTNGKVVSQEVTTMEILNRFLGFYPAKASSANDLVRMGKFSSAYVRSIKARYMVMYAKAKLEKDNEGVQDVLKTVREWNNVYRGTNFEITKFISSANRAYRASKLPALQRANKALPKTLQDDADYISSVYGLSY